MPNQSLRGSGSQLHFCHDLEPSCSTQTLTATIIREAKKKKSSRMRTQELEKPGMRRFLSDAWKMSLSVAFSWKDGER